MNLFMGQLYRKMSESQGCFNITAIQTLQAHVAAWSWQIGHKACFRQYASDIVDKTWDTIGVRSFCGFYRVSRQ